jgi:hypothetical protein
MLRFSVVLFTTICLLVGPVKAQQTTRLCIQDASSPNSCIPAGSSGGLTTTIRSVVIASGGTFQTVLAASNNRNSITIQNNNPLSGTEYCYIFVGSGNATTGTAIILGPGGSYQRYWPFIPADAIQATCTTTSDTLYVDTQ